MTFYAVLILMVLTSSLTSFGQERDKVLRRGNGYGYVHTLSFSPNGDRLLSATWDGMIEEWDLFTGKRLRVVDLEDGKRKAKHTVSEIYSMDESRLTNVISISFSQSSVLKGGLLGDRVERTALIDGESLRIKHVLMQTRSDMCFSPDGKTLVTVGPERIARIWSVESGNELHHFSIENVGKPIIYSQGTKLVVVSRIGWASEGPMIRVYDLKSGQIVKNIPDRFAQITGIAISPDDEKIAIGGANGDLFSLKVWDLSKLNKSEPSNLLSEDSKLAYNIAFSHDGQWLATSGLNGCCPTIAIRSLSDNKIVEEFKISDKIRSLAFAPKGNILAYGTDGGDIFLRNLKNETQ